MKTILKILTIFVLAIALNSLGQLQYNRFTTNADGSFINGGVITNVTATAGTNAILYGVTTIPGNVYGSSSFQLGLSPWNGIDTFFDDTNKTGFVLWGESGYGGDIVGSNLNPVLVWSDNNPSSITDIFDVYNPGSTGPFTVAFGIRSNGVAFGNGSSLTSLQASNIAPFSGTLPLGILTTGTTNLAGNLFIDATVSSGVTNRFLTQNGGGLTNVTANGLSTGSTYGGNPIIPAITNSSSAANLKTNQVVLTNTPWIWGQSNLVFLGYGVDSNIGTTPYAPLLTFDQAITNGITNDSTIEISPNTTIAWTNIQTIASNLNIDGNGGTISFLQTNNATPTAALNITGGVHYFNRLTINLIGTNSTSDWEILDNQGTNVWTQCNFIGNIDNFFTTTHQSGQNEEFLNCTFTSGYDLFNDQSSATQSTWTLVFDGCKFYSINLGYGQQAFGRVAFEASAPTHTLGFETFNNCYFYLTNGYGGNYVEIGAGTATFNGGYIYTAGGTNTWATNTVIYVHGGHAFVNINGLQGANQTNVWVASGATVTWATNYYNGQFNGSGLGMTNIPSTSITGGVTTNIQFTDSNLLNPSTNTLYFTNGILMKVTQP